MWVRRFKNNTRYKNRDIAQLSRYIRCMEALLPTEYSDEEMGVVFATDHGKYWFRPIGWALFWTAVPSGLVSRARAVCGR